MKPTTSPRNLRITHELEAIQNTIAQQDRVIAPCFSALDATGEAPLTQEERDIARALLNDEIGPLPALRPVMRSNEILRA